MWELEQASEQGYALENYAELSFFLLVYYFLPFWDCQFSIWLVFQACFSCMPFNNSTYAECFMVIVECSINLTRSRKDKHLAVSVGHN